MAAKIGSGWVEAFKFTLCLGTPFAMVWLYNSPLTQKWFNRQTPLFPPTDPNDDRFERAQELQMQIEARRKAKAAAAGSAPAGQPPKQ